MTPAYTVVWDGTRSAPGGVYLAAEDQQTRPAPAPVAVPPSIPLQVLRALVAAACPQTATALAARLEGRHSRSAVAGSVGLLAHRGLVREIGRMPRAARSWSRRRGEPIYAATEAGQTLAARATVRAL